MINSIDNLSKILASSHYITKYSNTDITCNDIYGMRNKLFIFNTPITKVKLSIDENDVVKVSFPELEDEWRSKFHRANYVKSISVADFFRVDIIPTYEDMYRKQLVDYINKNIRVPASMDQDIVVDSNCTSSFKNDGIRIESLENGNSLTIYYKPKDIKEHSDFYYYGVFKSNDACIYIKSIKDIEMFVALLNYTIEHED